jgi:hypothetical protein
MLRVSKHSESFFDSLVRFEIPSASEDRLEANFLGV